MFDFIVIGGGSAGYAAAATAARLGLKTAVVEGGREVGGLCILHGCMPSKTLIESANRMLAIRHAGEFGLHVKSPSADPKFIIERKRNLVAGFAEYRRSQLEGGAFEFIRGMGRFIDPRTLEVKLTGGGELQVQSKTFLIATGSLSNPLVTPGIEETGYKDSDAALEWEKIPESLVILGGGPTALEFAHYFSAMGTEVTILQRSGQLLSGMDADVARAVSDGLSKRGVRIEFNTTLLRAEKVKGRKRVHYRSGGKESWAEGAEILSAMGRHANLRPLDLEKAGLVCEESRPKVNARQQTDVPHLFAAGDAAGPYEIVHIAVQQGEIAARNAEKLIRNSTEAYEEMDYRTKVFAVFTSPEAAAAGRTEKELDASGTPYLAAEYFFRDHGKAMVMGETEGFVKLIVSRDSGEIVGAAAVGPHASELIHEAVVAIHFRAKPADLAATPHYHPTLSEIWTYPAEELSALRGRAAPLLF